MARAIVFKELRESAALVAVAALLALYFLAEMTGWRLNPFANYYTRLETIPFVSDSLYNAVAFVGAGLAIALGLKQSAWEQHNGTYLFLLHRPISRSRLFRLKIAVGAVVSVAVPLLMVLAYALWASTPGAHDAPFRWSMTLPAWAGCLSLVVVYLGAFASGLRPARWFGTRLLPLAVGGLATIFFNTPTPVVWSLPILLAAAAALAGTIAYEIQHRDF